jgi:hypothetical protein
LRALHQDGAVYAFFPRMAVTPRKLDIVVRPDTGGTFDTWVHSKQRPDGRWEGRLEFRPVPSGESIWTGVQTTQTNEAAVFGWAAGLSVSHIENAFTTSATSRKERPAGVPMRSTPPGRVERLEHLRPVEQYVLECFARRGTTSLETADIFETGPHSNSDYVRAFEDLEKSWRYLVRHTVEGHDLVELTPAGAQAAGLPAKAGSHVELERPKSML